MLLTGLECGKFELITIKCKNYQIQKKEQITITKQYCRPKKRLQMILTSLLPKQKIRKYKIEETELTLHEAKKAADIFKKYLM